MQDAIVLGGGISGLSTGYLLQQKGLDFSVIEKNSFPGGPIQSVIKDGFLVEKGPIPMSRSLDRVIYQRSWHRKL